MNTIIEPDDEGKGCMLSDAVDYCAMLDRLPAAACLLLDNSERVVLQANNEFYRLLGCPQKEFQYHYGGRLSAVTVGEWPTLQTIESGATVETEQKLRLAGRAERWLRISVRYALFNGEHRPFCILWDITAEKNAIASFQVQKSVFERASVLTGNETFSYDIVSRQAVIYRRGVILQQILPGEQENYGSFQRVFMEKDLVDEADREAFHNAFAAIERRESATCEVRMHTGLDTQQWMRLSMEMKESGSAACTTAVGILQNMTELKAANIHCLGEAQFLQAILSEKDAFVQVDISTDKMLRVGGRWFLYSGLIRSTSYSCLLEDYLGKTIHAEDYDYYLEFMRPDNLLQSLENGIDRLNCRVRRRFEQDRISWIEVDVFLFRNPLTQNTEALICSQRLDQNDTWTSAPAQEAERTCANRDAASPTLPEGDDAAFEHFIAQNGDMAYLVDMSSFELLLANDALYQQVGLTRSECAGKTCYWVMHHRESPCPFCGRANWSRDKFYIWKNWNAILQQDYLIKNKIVVWQGREVLLALAVDVAQNKSFLDTLDDGGGESHSILAGIQRMAEADSHSSAVQSALETIGFFFGAGAVQYWEYHSREDTFLCNQEWKLDATFLDDPCEQHILQTVNHWLHERRWTYSVNIENQEAMLCHSFEMYELMKDAGIWNQRWIPLREGETLWGILVIVNAANHFQNTSFMETFSVFMVESWQNKARIDEMVFANYHDDVSGCANRKSYERFVQEYSPDGLTSLGVVSTIINDLEDINKQQGFQAGDDCVRHFASKLQSAFHEGKVYRLSGAEFIAIQPNFSLEKLSARLEELEDEVVSCRKYSVSTGYSWDNIERELPQLVQQASQSMLLNKQQQFDASRSHSDEERQIMLQELMAALGNREYEVFLQPKVNLLTEKLMGAEALVRYRDRSGNIIPPSRFIDVLERNNLIRFVDFFVFEECCRVLERWRTLGLELPVISFNFSRLTLLERDIVSSVQTIFGKYRVPKEKVEIEITESVGELGKGVLYQAAHELYQAGFSISLDDFGTKYTNLDILSELDFDMLKVDKSLVSLLTKRRSNQIILQNILTMCKHLNISVVAEGVETKTQEAVLRSLGCRYGQGYLYGRPMAISEFEERFMNKRNESGIS